MRVGVVLPQTEIGADPAAIAAYARGVEGLGYRHILAYDHVLGADPAVHRELRGPYNLSHTFHEPMVLFGYLAAITSLELVTGIIILPQRQTALVAKQAAEIDILTRGHLRLGVGLGWNPVEYEALGKSFNDRGRRVEEQVLLLRRLWTEAAVTHRGEHERITAAGLAPPPRQRPIPIWFGGSSPAALRRAGRLADGWFPQADPGPELERARSLVKEGAVSAGRDPGRIGMEGVVSWTREGAGRIAQEVRAWAEAGATHVSISTMRAGLGGVEEHLAALAQAASAINLELAPDPVTDPQQLGRADSQRTAPEPE